MTALPPLPPDAALLRALPGRRVWAEPQRVVKAFWAPYPWSRGGFKSRREARLLSALAQRGLPVPRLLGRERRAGWELLYLERIPQALPLDEWLQTPGRSRSARRRVLERSAAALAGLQSEGLRQRDAHPGNWLIDGAERPVAIDFERAALGTRFRKGCARRELARLAALLTPLTAIGERLRALAAWRAALPEGARAGLPSARVWRRELAREAERRRRSEIRAELDRWLRPGSRLETPSASQAPAAGGRVQQRTWLVNRRLPGSARAAAADWLAGAPPPAGAWESCGRPGPTRRRWLAAALELEHGLPVLWPAALDRSDPRRWRALFLRPEPVVSPGSSAAPAAPAGWRQQLEAERARRGLRPLRDCPAFGPWSAGQPWRYLPFALEG